MGIEARKELGNIQALIRQVDENALERFGIRELDRGLRIGGHPHFNSHRRGRASHFADKEQIAAHQQSRARRGRHFSKRCQWSVVSSQRSVVSSKWPVATCAN